MNDENDEKVEDIFDEDGRMKDVPSGQAGPTNSAKRKTLFICAGLIVSVLAISFIVSNTKAQSDTSQEVSVDEEINESNQTYEYDIFNQLNNDSSNFVSKDGLLYNFADDKYVREGENDILYVYPSDILLVKGEVVESQEPEDLTAYVVLNNDSEKMLIDENGQSDTLTNEQYENLLNKYYTNRDEILYPVFSSADFQELAFMSMMAMNENEKIDVTFVNTRYLAINGDYGVVICSPEGDDADLHGYIFRKKNGQWEIIESEYQLINNYQNYVNNKYGYMDIDLLLNMDINEYPKDSFVTELDDVVNGMLEANIITDSDLPKTYGVGYDNLMYLEFSSGLAFVGVVDENGVTTYPVVNTFETKTIFEKFNDNPPYIILKQY